ncbi:hypothetical protein Pelo_253 [Pelomyxa schiedti]|nr:hypothetical protein Pelo_253 [Pelomyxa schiedti]
MGKCWQRIIRLNDAIVSVVSCYGFRMAVYFVLTWNLYEYNWAYLIYDPEATYEQTHNEDCYAWSDGHCNSTDYLIEQKHANNATSMTTLYSILVLAVMSFLGLACMAIDSFHILCGREPEYCKYEKSSLSAPAQAWSLLKCLKKCKGKSLGFKAARFLFVAVALCFCAFPLLSIGIIWYCLVSKPFEIEIRNIPGMTTDVCVCSYQYKDNWGQAQVMNSITGSLLLSWCFLRFFLCWATGTIYSKTCFLAFDDKLAILQDTTNKDASTPLTSIS